MKAMHVALLAALLAVGAVVALLLQGEGDERRGREPAPEASAPEGPEAVRPHTGPGGPGIRLLVVAPDGTPAAGAEVEAEGAVERAARAGRDGRVALDDLVAGFYVLRARHGDAAGAMEFVLEETRDLGTLRLRPAVRLAGRVRTAGGKPLRGTVTATAGDPEGGFRGRAVRERRPEAALAVAHAAADGSYELLLPGPGAYGLHAWAPGYRPASEEPRTWDASRDGIDFHLVPGGELAGRVAGPDGTAVAGAAVTQSQGFPGDDRLSVFTGADGGFRMPVPGEGTVRLVVSAPGFAATVRDGVRLPSPPLEIVLERGRALRFRAVDGDTGRPLEGIRAFLRFANLVEEVTTDRNGEGWFRDVDDAAAGGQRTMLYLGGGAWAPRSVVVERAETRPDGVLDLGDVALERGGTVRGRVLTEGAKVPVAGATVAALPARDWLLALMVSPTAVSGADGSYEIEGVPLEGALLAASHPDYVPATDMNQLFARIRRGGTEIFPPGVREARVDLFVLPAAAVAGVVVGPGGAPVADARVGLRERINPIAGLLPAPPREAVTDDLGRFALKGLRPGERVRILAEHRAYGPSEETDAVAGDAAAVTLRLRPVLLLEGRVVDEDDAPLEGVGVTARAKDARPVFGPGAQGSTGVSDADGRFVVRNAPAGEITVDFRHEAYQPGTLETAVPAGAERHDLGTTVLHRGPSILGVVVDVADAPVPGASVWASYQREGGGVFRRNERWFVNTVTDAGGRFALRGLMEGSYAITVRQAGLFASRQVLPTGTEDARFVLQPEARLRVRVTAGGRPVEGARVQAEMARPEGGTEFLGAGVTDAEGLAALGRLPPDEPFALRVRHPGYRELALEGARAGGGIRDLVLQEGAKVAGLVVDPEGAPVRGMAIRVLVKGEQAAWVRTDDKGRFEAGGLDEGPVQLDVRAGDTGFIAPPPVPAATGDLEVRIVLERGRSIRGTVREADGKPAVNVLVSAHDAEGTQHAATWVGAGDGSFELRGLPEGSYTLRLQANRDGRMETVAERTGVAGGATGIELRIP